MKDARMRDRGGAPSSAEADAAESLDPRGVFARASLDPRGVRRRPAARLSDDRMLLLLLDLCHFFGALTTRREGGSSFFKLPTYIYFLPKLQNVSVFFLKYSGNVCKSKLLQAII